MCAMYNHSGAAARTVWPHEAQGTNLVSCLRKSTKQSGKWRNREVENWLIALSFRCSTQPTMILEQWAYNKDGPSAKLLGKRLIRPSLQAKDAGIAQHASHQYQLGPRLTGRRYSGSLLRMQRTPFSGWQMHLEAWIAHD